LNTIKTATLGAFTLFLTGCSSTWVLQDDLPASSEQLKAAKEVCKVEDKLYNFRFTEMTYDAAAQTVSAPEKKAEFKAILETKKEKLYTEIEECMNEQGLKRKN